MVKNCKHSWLRCEEQVEAFYHLKKNTLGLKEIWVKNDSYVCKDCSARGIASPWTGEIIEIEPA